MSGKVREKSGNLIMTGEWPAWEAFKISWLMLFSKLGKRLEVHAWLSVCGCVFVGLFVQNPRNSRRENVNG